MKIDELNFFSSMQIDDEQKKKRKKISDDFIDAFLFFFTLIKDSKENNLTDMSFALIRLQEQLQDVVTKHVHVDSYLIMYLAHVSQEVYSTTLKHINEEWFLSKDRATFLALNEANSVFNHTELETAKKEGYTFKIWHTEMDDRVRPTHEILEGVKKPIDDYFDVGNSRLQFPRDVVNCSDLEDIANCRCSLSYSKEE